MEPSADSINTVIPMRPAMANLPRTVHGGKGWMLDNVEDYSHNLNPFGPPEDLAEIVASAIPQVGHYPDDSCAELREVIAKTFNVATDCISVGAGSSDIIRNVPNTFYGRHPESFVRRVHPAVQDRRRRGPSVRASARGGLQDRRRPSAGGRRGRQGGVHMQPQQPHRQGGAP